MKNLLLLSCLLFVSFSQTTFSQKQECEFNKIDEFTGQWKFMTLTATLNEQKNIRATQTAIQFALYRVDSTCFIYATIMAGVCVDVLEGQNMYLKMDNDTILTLTRPKQESSVKASSGYYLSYNIYPIALNDIDFIAANKIKLIRAETSIGAIDFTISEKGDKNFHDIITYFLSVKKPKT